MRQPERSTLGARASSRLTACSNSQSTSISGQSRSRPERSSAPVTTLLARPAPAGEPALLLSRVSSSAMSRARTSAPSASTGWPDSAAGPRSSSVSIRRRGADASCVRSRCRACGRRDERWTSTVFGVTNRFWAMSRLVMPSAAIAATRSSLGVSELRRSAPGGAAWRRRRPARCAPTRERRRPARLRELDGEAQRLAGVDAPARARSAAPKSASARARSS